MIIEYRWDAAQYAVCLMRNDAGVTCGRMMLEISAGAQPRRGMDVRGYIGYKRLRQGTSVWDGLAVSSTPVLECIIFGQVM
jgi:hypothetical protein